MTGHLQRILMFTSLVLLFGIYQFLNGGREPVEDKTTQQVNALIGDISYLDRYGILPGPQSDETDRITTHLRYVLDRLRDTETAHLPLEHRVARQKHLANLAAYIRNAKFPQNNAYPDERRPCFIDRHGNFCAVGYLVAQSTGRAAAEAINRQYQYAYIDEIDHPLLDEWLTPSGLTRTEIAMIQPTYGYLDENDNGDIETVEIGLIGANIATSFMNSLILASGDGSPVLAGMGIATGIAGITAAFSDRASHKNTDVFFGSLSLMLSVGSLIIDRDRGENNAPAADDPPATTGLTPRLTLTSLPAGDSHPVMAINMQWRF